MKKLNKPRQDRCKKRKKDTRWRERKPSITIETSSSVVARHTYCSSFVVAHRNSQRNRGCQLRELNHIEADAEEENRSGYALPERKEAEEEGSVVCSLGKGRPQHWMVGARGLLGRPVVARDRSPNRIEKSPFPSPTFTKVRFSSLNFKTSQTTSSTF
jgi:hypothetical protein